MNGASPGHADPPRRGSASARGATVWRELPHERRLAAIGAFGLFLTLFLPWYQGEVITGGVSGLRGLSYTLTGWQSFTWVEAAVLLVAVCVLILLFMRAQGNAFHVPGGDGGVITGAGLWTCLLVLWRMFDKQGVTGHGQYDTATGIEWGIFIALAVAAFLAYAGSRIRAAREPEPPLPGETEPRAGSGRRPWRREPGPGSSPAAATRVVRSPEAPTSRSRDETPVVRPESPRQPRDATTVVRPAPPNPPRDPTTVVAPPPAQAAGEHRPRSLGEPGARPGAPDASGARRGLDRTEIQDLDIAEPPTARLGRSDGPHGPPA